MQQRELFESRKRAIVDRWAKLALSVYPPESARIMSHEKDRFQNPVGRITRESLEALYDGLISARPTQEMASHVGDIVRIRAVQDLSPSAAVEFLFLLKRAVREGVGDGRAAGSPRPDFTELDASIDRLALVAFDLFIQCREKIYELRVREIKRRASVMLERMQGSAAEGTAPADECGSCQQVKGGCGA